MPVRPVRSRRRVLPALLAPVLLLLPLAGVPGAAPAAADDGVTLVPGATAVLRGSGERSPTTVAPSRSLLRSRTAAASSTFVVTYTGFSTVQRDAFQLAVDTWARLLASPVPIRIDAQLRALPPGVLGAAGAVNYAVDDANGRYGPEDTLAPVALANALAGRDLDPDDPDIAADFSTDPTLFSYGPDAVPGRYDFTTVVLHEIGHGLGFAGAMSVQAGSDGVRRGFWNPGTTTPRPYVFDRHTVTPRADGSVVPLLSLRRGSSELAQALTDGRSQWDGPAATAANDGVRPELYTPATWEQGSSYSHLDEGLYPPGDPDALMTPLLDLGEVARDPGAVALGMLADLGWGSETRSLRLSGPETADAGTRVAVTGTAVPGTVVRLYFKRRGSTTTSPGARPGFTLAREIPVGDDARFDTSYVASDDHRYYAQVGDQVSEPVLTQVRPTFTGAPTRVVRRGSTVTLRGRGLPGTVLTLRFSHPTGGDVVRALRVRADGTWSRSQVLAADLRVGAQGSNGQRSATTVLLQAR